MRKKQKDNRGQGVLWPNGKPWTDHEPLKPIIQPGEQFLVDGCNVLNVRGKDKPPSLRILLILLLHIRKSGRDFHCIFDANARHTLLRYAGKPDQKTYLQLLGKHSSHFTESTGGMRADEPLLQRAEKFQQRIISNDRFKDKWDVYPWLQNEEDWLIKVLVVGNSLQIPDLKILADCSGELEELFHELECLLP